MDAAEIRKRISIADIVIQMLEKDDDPRAPEVARILGEQKAELEAQLPGAQQAAPPPATEDGQPPPVVVGLKALEVKAKRL